MEQWQLTAGCYGGGGNQCKDNHGQGARLITTKAKKL